MLLLEGESEQVQAVCISLTAGDKERPACTGHSTQHLSSGPWPSSFLTAAFSLLQPGCFPHGFQRIRHGSGVTAARFTFP